MQPVELHQKKFSSKTDFLFKDEAVEYTLTDKSGSWSTTISYLGVQGSTISTVVGRNEWYRNVGYLWIILGIAFPLVGNLSGVIFVFLGAGCLAYYYFVCVSYTVLQSDKGSILIINDSKQQEIINLLNEGKKRVILRQFGEINYSSSLEEEKEKYRHLREQNFVSTEEFNAFLVTMEENKDKFKKSTQ